MADEATGTTEPEGAEQDSTRESVAEALTHLEVVNIFPIEVAASLDGPPLAVDIVDSDIDIDYLAQEGLFSNRFSWTVKMFRETPSGEDDARVAAGDAAAEPAESNAEDGGEALPDGLEPVASFRFTFQVDYEVDAGYRVASSDASAITRTTGLFAAYPYARELLQNLSGRLQLDPLVLGKLMRGEVRPAGITRVERGAALVSMDSTGTIRS